MILFKWLNADDLDIKVPFKFTDSEREILIKKFNIPTIKSILDGSYHMPNGYTFSLNNEDEALDALIELEADHDEEDTFNYNSIQNKLLRDLFLKKGYDGIVYYNEYEGTGNSYIAFNSNQVKSIHNIKPTNSNNINENKNKLALRKSLFEHDSDKDKNDNNSNELDSEGNSISIEQSNFFKDSKIRDSSGKLLLVYHGTNVNFDEFKKERNDGSRTRVQSFWFSSSSDIASTYHNNSGKVLSGYLNIKNPFIYDCKNSMWSRIPVNNKLLDLLQRTDNPY